MADATAQLIKLEEELIDRVDSLEKENAVLRKQAAEADSLLKQASVAANDKPVVSAEVAARSVEAMHKLGALNDDQLDAARQKFLEDAEAPHRILQQLIDAQLQTKTASTSASEDVSGGRIANAPAKRASAEDSCMDKMQRILGMI